MSLFDYPRINFLGTVQLSPGTANNDDYAGAVTLPASWGPPYAGQTLALIDSKMVAARTYGMSDEAFIAWAQKAQTFDVTGKPGQTQQIIPAEWNYYGAMGSKTLTVTVVGVQTGPQEVYSASTDGVELTSLIGAPLTFSGHITDVNSEGSPPATQFFIDSLTLTSGGQTLLSGMASKAACQWLNFYRNVNLTADGGAGGYVYHVIMKGPGTTIDIPGFAAPEVVGVVCRYYLYAMSPGVRDNAAIEALYTQGKTNPATLQIVGTLAPLLAGDTILAAPVGRLMVSNATPIPTPQGTRNNGNVINGISYIALAPAVLQVNGNLISADFSGTFPDYYQGTSNDKFDFGPVSLVVSGSAGSAVVGSVDYANTPAGNQQGWLFDFDISTNAEAQEILSGGDATFQLVQASLGNVLEETAYYFVTNQQAIYTEQLGSGTEFVNQGTAEPATVSVYQYGQELAADACPPVTVWQYRSIPMQAPGDAEAIDTDFGPGQPLDVDTSQPGNFLFTLTVGGDTPPQSYATFMFPPYLTNWPSISLRILPNDEDFSQYYVDPSAAEPVGNDLLTFDVVYDKVLRTYYLLYPAMNNQAFPLNSEEDCQQHAQAILDRTDPAIWMSKGYMPRTRDMSASRRTLLQAWCRKVRPAGGS